MSKLSRILLTVETILVFPFTVYLSLLAAMLGARLAGIQGGSWGWGYMFAVVIGLVAGAILSISALAMLKSRNSFNHLSVLLSAFVVAGANLIVSFAFHLLTRLVF